MKSLDCISGRQREEAWYTAYQFLDESDLDVHEVVAGCDSSPRRTTIHRITDTPSFGAMPLFYAQAAVAEEIDRQMRIIIEDI